MKTYFSKVKPSLFFTLFTALVLNACTFPVLFQVSPTPTVPTATQKFPAITETIISTQDSTDSACYFNWAKKALPELSKKFEEALKDVSLQADGYAEAYGENCINQDNEVVYFAAMETDFYITLNVEDLEDKQVLGDLIEEVFTVMEKFPAEETPGPQPGYVGITFEASDDSIYIWVMRTEVESALENGLQGAELINSLQAK
jgi:hypothetical protein